jgi:hypothetical protein
MTTPSSDDQAVRKRREARLASPASTYERHLIATAAWIDHGRGGSCAYYSPVMGWSRPYPETTGYLIPTLIGIGRVLRSFEGEERAIALGSWLLDIQRADGAWHGGVHPPKKDPRPSVFNTAQVLRGLVALHDLTAEQRWLDAAARATRWLASGVGTDGLWAARDYRAAGTPSYYTYAASPMLEVARRIDDDGLRGVAVRVLHEIRTRRRPNGTFGRWAFSATGAAFTHTIAYTLQGFLEAAQILGDWAAYGEPVEEALDELARIAAKVGGQLPGKLDDDWAPAARYVCLTGNAQVALCLLDWNERQPDSRLVVAADALVGFVCSNQRLGSPLTGVKGAAAGSAPLWGRYMTLRYPNWAAKYLCDALIRLHADPDGR